MKCPNTGWGKNSKNDNRVDSFIWHLGVHTYTFDSIYTYMYTYTYLSAFTEKKPLEETCVNGLMLSF